nr:MAG TPA: hypothetical protein [Caudoviricetes sp.]
MCCYGNIYFLFRFQKVKKAHDITTLFNFGGIKMRKEPLTITQKSTILSLREQAKQLLREIPLKDAIAICNEVIKETSNAG